MRRLLQFHYLVLAVLTSLTMLGAGDSGQRFEKIGHELMCTCGCNQILLECNHVGCQVSGGMRDEISAGLSRGGNNDQILKTFVEKYGPVVLAAPTKVGFDRAAWIAPFAVFFVGIGLVMMVVRSWRLRTPSVLMEDAGSPNDHFETLRKRARQDTEL
jgi:cytochrome c-type biogenesis protein CcmH/NrfF